MQKIKILYSKYTFLPVPLCLLYYIAINIPKPKLERMELDMRYDV